ncbi:HDOD domain-containing protein [Oceanispirochaeta crateris]|uniref:HDOD domain-containing protein n=1 Tax=Oceanispirochaeta crateris TaxID=2518645 RepID=A0A5C1QG63_9SPIO|nr:HDOD domain-containing protein [Oceanispirochaeta crateris]QEN07055.1 HDOD domain-containing protein [Oceanispirochaeta crateris]
MDKYEQFLKNIPIMPDVATKVLTFAEDMDEVSFAELERLISMDPGLTAKILKVANSSLYARQQQISRLQTAISLMGFKAIKSLIMLLTASNMFSQKSLSPFYKYFWQHSLVTAFISQKLCDMSGASRIREESFLAGLLHDIGQMSLYESELNAYDKIMPFINVDEGKTCSEETSMFGVNHREIGRRIMESWNFPQSFSDTAGEHGNLNIQSPHKEMIVIVSIADLLTSVLHEIDFSEKMKTALDPYLKYSGLKLEQLNYFQDKFMVEMKDDPLFQECKSLFRL